MKNILVIFATSIILFGCTKFIEFDDEVKRSKIVVNGVVQNNQSALVHISRSLSVIDNANLNVIDDAEIKLYGSDGNLMEILNPFNDTLILADQSGFYRGEILLDENEEYSIEISAPSYETVSSTTNIPQFNLVQTSPLDSLSSYDVEYGESSTNFTFHFADNGSEENYYGIKAYGIGQYNDDNEIWVFTEDVSVDINSGNEIFFTDNFFNGATHDLKLKISTINYGVPYIDSLIVGNNKFDSIRFVMNSYSRDMYLYQKSYQAYQNVDDFFSQPVQVYSNVENGLGVFGGIKEDIYTIAID